MFSNHFLLAIALFLVVGGLIPVVSPQHFAGEAVSQTIAEPRYHRVFQPLLARLRAGTKIPIRLPQEMPDAGKSPLYASLNEINPDRYSIELAFAPDCYGATACRFGEVSGEKKTLLGKNAQLAIRKNFQVDFDAIAVSQSGQIQYYILYPSGETFRDSDTLKILVTDNPNYRTEKGVSPGMSLARGEQIYGEATLYRNTANESREYIKFAHFPVTNIYFRPGTKTGESAGIYPPDLQEYQETTRYREGTIIRSIEVILR